MLLSKGAGGKVEIRALGLMAGDAEAGAERDIRIPHKMVAAFTGREWRPRYKEEGHKNATVYRSPPAPQNPPFQPEGERSETPSFPIRIEDRMACRMRDPPPDLARDGPQGNGDGGRGRRYRSKSGLHEQQLIHDAAARPPGLAARPCKCVFRPTRTTRLVVLAWRQASRSAARTMTRSGRDAGPRPWGR